MFRKELTFTIVVLFVGAGVVSAFNVNLVNESKPMNRGWLYVGGSETGNYTHIQYAIDNATSGDTVFVYNGTYYEHPVINKSINLIGEDRNTTTIDGGGSGNVTNIINDNVIISGFTIQNSGDFGWDAGVDIHSNYNIISDNIITSNTEGIKFRASSSYNNILNNAIISNTDDNIWLYYANDNIISGNNISNNYRGIILQSSNNNIIFNNNIRADTREGIYLEYSDETNNIYLNTISFSNIGVRIVSSSENNTIYHNNFINNTINAWDECTNIWNDSYPSGGNYWDDYSGVDNYHGPNQSIPGPDGIGDTPYNISGGNNQDLYPLIHLFGPPYAEFTYNNETSELDASLSGDYNGVIVDYEWDFGDGEFGNGDIIHHKYCVIGTYNVTLTVTDDDGLKGSITKSVDVLLPNIPPITPEIFGPNSGKTGIEYEYAIIWADPDVDMLYLWVEWGDGNSTGWLGPLGSGEPVKLGHKWNQSGTYTIKAKLKDDCGAESPWGEFEVKMPRNNLVYNEIIRFFKSYPLLFKILNTIFKYSWIT